MKRHTGTILYAVLLIALTAAYVRSAWLMPWRNYPFDFSINYTGARLLSLTGHDGDIYNRALLAETAAPYTAYETLYTKLYLTYIQTPLTAVLLMPVAGLDLADARSVMLIVSNTMLLAGAAVMVYALGATRLLVLAAFVIFATYEAMFDSLRLGNMDAPIVALLALGFLALRRRRPWLVGAPLAAAAMLKVSPAIVLGYFVWRRDRRVLAGAAFTGVLLLALSFAIAGKHNHVIFVRDVAPKLARGSAFYDNISLGGALARAHFGEAFDKYEDELPPWPLWLRAAAALLGGAIIVGSYVVARRDVEAGYMLCTAVAVLVPPISWSFYPTWLIPSLLFLVSRIEQRRAWNRLALLIALYPWLSIVPAHFGAIDDHLYRYPIKTVALALYCGLLAWEARAGNGQRATSHGQRAAESQEPAVGAVRP
jgi:hypothetical protein